ncbi:hypothetical protein DQ392_19475 [Streptomyces reniochalinae]|uniref:Uncharacterized protein n=1 Tax=Streptomyces reniochalinae TaxID=2250578 RepID=A0A367EE63_9ACTN|nr:hypothetical protein DQ392_19475 [Streptomyces reniochalinae]
MCIPKEPQPTGTTRQVGVSTYLALTFGTLLSSQGTDASFKTVSPVSPDVCPFGVHYFSSFSPRLIIESFRIVFGVPKATPAKGYTFLGSDMPLLVRGRSHWLEARGKPSRLQRLGLR